VSGSGICWAICKSWPRQIITPASHHSCLHSNEAKYRFNILSLVCCLHSTLSGMCQNLSHIMTTSVSMYEVHQKKTIPYKKLLYLDFSTFFHQYCSAYRGWLRPLGSKAYYNIVLGIINSKVDLQSKVGCISAKSLQVVLAASHRLLVALASSGVVIFRNESHSAVYMVCIQPPRTTQPCHPSMSRQNEYWQWPCCLCETLFFFTCICRPPWGWPEWIFPTSLVSEN